MLDGKTEVATIEDRTRASEIKRIVEKLPEEKQIKILHIVKCAELFDAHASATATRAAAV